MDPATQDYRWGDVVAFCGAEVFHAVAPMVPRAKPVAGQEGKAPKRLTLNFYSEDTQHAKDRTAAKAARPPPKARPAPKARG